MSRQSNSFSFVLPFSSFPSPPSPKSSSFYFSVLQNSPNLERPRSQHSSPLILGHVRRSGSLIILDPLLLQAFDSQVCVCACESVWVSRCDNVGAVFWVFGSAGGIVVVVDEVIDLVVVFFQHVGIVFPGEEALVRDVGVGVELDVLAGAKVTAAVVAVVGHVCCVLCVLLLVEIKVACSE
jgi:hypothetical protein